MTHWVLSLCANRERGQEVRQPEVRQRLQREFCLQGLKDSEAAELQGLALLILNAESQRALEEAVGG